MGLFAGSDQLQCFCTLQSSSCTAVISHIINRDQWTVPLAAIVAYDVLQMWCLCLGPWTGPFIYMLSSLHSLILSVNMTIHHNSKCFLMYFSAVWLTLTVVDFFRGLLWGHSLAYIYVYILALICFIFLDYDWKFYLVICECGIVCFYSLPDCMFLLAVSC